jgi:hypothetical protein
VLRTKEAYNETVFLRHDREAIKRAEERLRKQAAKFGFQLAPKQEHESEALACSSSLGVAQHLGIKQRVVALPFGVLGGAIHRAAEQAASRLPTSQAVGSPLCCFRCLCERLDELRARVAANPGCSVARLLASRSGRRRDRASRDYPAE